MFSGDTLDAYHMARMHGLIIQAQRKGDDGTFVVARLAKRMPMAYAA